MLGIADGVVIIFLGDVGGGFQNADERIIEFPRLSGGGGPTIGADSISVMICGIGAEQRRRIR